jgi:hypothetical protein
VLTKLVADSPRQSENAQKENLQALVARVERIWLQRQGLLRLPERFDNAIESKVVSFTPRTELTHLIGRCSALVEGVALSNCNLNDARCMTPREMGDFTVGSSSLGTPRTRERKSGNDALSVRSIVSRVCRSQNAGIAVDDSSTKTSKSGICADKGHEFDYSFTFRVSTCAVEEANASHLKSGDIALPSTRQTSACSSLKEQADWSSTSHSFTASIELHDEQPACGCAFEKVSLSIEDQRDQCSRFPCDSDEEMDIFKILDFTIF